MLWEQDTLLSNEIAMYYRDGDADAVAVVNRAAEICGKAVFSILNLFNPEIIVFNGGFVQQLGDIFLVPVREEAEKCMNAVYSVGDNRIPIVVGELANPVLVGALKMAIEGSGGKVRRSKQQVLAALSEGLQAHDRAVLNEMYREGKPVAINKHPDGPYYKNKLRQLRNQGLIRTRGGQSFRNSDAVELTELGKIVVEETLRAES